MAAGLAFQENLVEGLLGLIWEAYDELARTDYRRVEWSLDLRNVERNLTKGVSRVLQVKLRTFRDGYHALTVQPEQQEFATQRGNRGQAPTYDIAFEWNGDDRVMWGVEAKVLLDDRDTEGGPGEYVSEGVNRFLERRYAPFVGSGAMLAFLRSGSAIEIASHISRRLGVSLSTSIVFSERHHWTSIHNRATSEGSGTEPFTCHHLVFELSTESSNLT